MGWQVVALPSILSKPLQPELDKALGPLFEPGAKPFARDARQSYQNENST